MLRSLRVGDGRIPDFHHETIHSNQRFQRGISADAPAVCVKRISDPSENQRCRSKVEQERQACLDEQDSQLARSARV